MIELNLIEKKPDDELYPVKRDLKVRFIPRIGETIKYYKRTYKVIGVEYDISSTDCEIVNVLVLDEQHPQKRQAFWT